MKRILLLLFVFQISAFAQKKEDEVAVQITALENEKISQNILSSELYQKCKDLIQEDGALDTAKIDEVRKCIEDAVSGASDEQLEEIGSALEISAAKFKETKGSKSLKNYLHKRIFNAIHGENAYENQKLKEMKFVDQAMFLQLYKSQISKNLILEVSQYCLENLGTTKATELFLGFNDLEKIEEAFSETAKGTSKEVSALTINVAKKDASDPNKDWTKIPNVADLSKSSTKRPAKEFWQNIVEYKYCPKIEANDKKKSCHKDVARNAQQISVLKDQELEIGKENTEILSIKYASCSSVVIKNMCEIYRCQNVYTADSSSLLYKPDSAGGPNAKNVCKNLYGISIASSETNVSLEVGSGKTAKGQIACNVLKKVERYKNTFAAIDEMEKQNGKIGKATGVEVNSTFKDVYDGKGMDNLTSISSKELVENVDGLGEDGIKELEEKCLSGADLSKSEDCQGLAGSINEADLTKIQLDTEAETQAYLARVAKLKGKGDEEEMKKYLIENGLHEYAAMYGDTLNDEQAIALISDKYKADRKALINNMQKRFENMTQKTADTAVDKGQVAANAAGSTKKDVAENNLEEIRQHKERLETLFNYSNIVSSYLSIKNNKTGEVTQNTRTRAIETEDLKKRDPENAEDYKEYFVDSGVDESEGSVQAKSFVDSILGIGASEE